MPLEPLICDACGCRDFDAVYRSVDMIYVSCASCRTIQPVGIALEGPPDDPLDHWEHDPTVN